MGITTTTLPNVVAARPALPGSGILLLTPYTGGNLGDAAIQEALVHNIRKRLSSPKIQLVTLRPRVTSKMHGLPSFPICPFAPDGDTPSLSGSGADSDFRVGFAQQNQNSAGRRNWIYRILLSPRHGFKITRSFLRRARREVAHSVRAFRLLKGTTLLVMSGGGQIDDFWGGAFGHPWALFKWACLARMAGTQVVFLSVGVCSLQSPWSRYFAHRALRLAAYRSYRDGESKRLLGDAAFTHDDPVYPDLAFSHPCAKENHSAQWSFSNDGLVVGFSPIACFSPSVWPEHNEPVYQRYIRILSEFVTRILEAGHTVVLFTTSLMDKVAVKDLREALSATLERNDHMVQLRSVDQIELNQQLREIEKMDMVIASRLHGIILSHLLGKPALAISYDRKVRTHMTAMTQERYCLDLGDCALFQLWDRFTALASELKPVADGICQKVADYRQQLDRQYDFFTKL
ncbi:MAG: polysaccharide pyruvyl transferase family protein [Limisphaerales bacterium]